MAAEREDSTKVHKVPTFLKNLAELTKACPTDVGEWSEDASQFVVKSCKFADLVRNHFDVGLETFVRQLHFYSFKRSECSNGRWSFAHPNFQRDRPDLIFHIRRKANVAEVNAKKRPRNEKDTEENPLQGIRGSLQKLEAGLESTLQKLDTGFKMFKSHLSDIAEEALALKLRVQALERLTAAENLLSLGPEARNVKQRCIQIGKTGVRYQTETSLHRDSDLLAPNPTPSSLCTSADGMVAEMLAADRNLENPVLDMTELEDEFFVDFDDILKQLATPVPFPDTSSSSAVAAAIEVSSSSDTVRICDTRCGSLTVPEEFELKQGVTIQLLKDVHRIIVHKCRDAGMQHCVCTKYMKKLSRELPHPSTLTAVEECQLSREMLPALRQGVDERTSDQALMHAVRHIYELFYATRTKKLQQHSLMSDSAGCSSCIE